MIRAASTVSWWVPATHHSQVEQFLLRYQRSNPVGRGRDCPGAGAREVPVSKGTAGPEYRTVPSSVWVIKAPLCGQHERYSEASLQWCKVTIVELSEQLQMSCQLSSVGTVQQPLPEFFSRPRRALSSVGHCHIIQRPGYVVSKIFCDCAKLSG